MSLLRQELCSAWPDLTVSERPITLPEVLAANAGGRLLEMFGSGTAAVISPVGGLRVRGEMHRIPTPTDGLAARVATTMADIYYGRQPHHWVVDVNEWMVEDEVSRDKLNLEN